MTRRPPIPTEDEVPASALKGLAYTRAVGVATGIFLIAWAPFNAVRWQGQGPEWLLNLEFGYFIVFGIMLALPWGKIQAQKLWRFLFGGLVLLAAGFGFLMVIDLMFQYMLAAGELTPAEGDSLFFLSSQKGDEKPAPPAFQSTLIFTSLIQVPAVYFVRNPRAMT